MTKSPRDEECRPRRLGPCPTPRRTRRHTRAGSPTPSYTSVWVEAPLALARCVPCSPSGRQHRHASAQVQQLRFLRCGSACSDLFGSLLRMAADAVERSVRAALKDRRGHELGALDKIERVVTVVELDETVVGVHMAAAHNYPTPLRCRAGRQGQRRPTVAPWAARRTSPRVPAWLAAALNGPNRGRSGVTSTVAMPPSTRPALNFLGAFRLFSEFNLSVTHTTRLSCVTVTRPYSVDPG
jgi:hypothetical protein